MSVHPSAGAQIPDDRLVDVVGLLNAYHDLQPDPDDPAQRVSFGTSGHRGSSTARTLQRGARAGDHAGDLRLPEKPGHRRSAVSWQGHARAISAGVHDRSRGAGRERRLDDDR